MGINRKTKHVGWKGEDNSIAELKLENMVGRDWFLFYIFLYFKKKFLNLFE